MDMYPDRKAYIVTAHWMEDHQKHINLRADLLDFVNATDGHSCHTGKCLAKVFFIIIDHLDINKKISFLIDYIFRLILFYKLDGL
jgi:hypothetical protein